MKKKWFIAAVVLVLTVMAAGCSLKGGISDQGGAETQKERKERRRVDPEEFEAEEILWVDLMSYHEETDEREEISLWLEPGEGEADIDGEKYELSDDRCNELQKLILEYSLRVKEQEDEYWPDTDEYPDMLVLFEFEMNGEEKRYRATGALCYPDGWEDFIGDLKEMAMGQEEEPEEKTEKLPRVDPQEFTAEEIIWFDFESWDEKTYETEEISLWLDPEEGGADINGEKYELNDDQCNELQKLILEYSLTVEEKRDEYWPTGDYPAMPVLFQFEMTGWEKYYVASGALCYPDGWKEFVGTLKETVGISGSGQKTAGTGKSAVSPETGALKDKTAELEQVSPEEFAEDEISFFSLLSYYEDTEEIEGITLFLYPGEEEAHIVSGGEEDRVDEVRLNEEQSDALKQLILQYSRTVWEQEDEYWPSDTEEASVMTMIFDFRMSGEKKEYKANGGLCYPDGWEDFIEELKKIIS